MPKKISQEELMQRQSKIIDASCSIIEVQGFSGLTMDKVVAEVPFSKGSVYKLFSSVEDILLAITNEGSKVLLDFLERAYNFGGNSRDKNLARAFAYHLYGQLYPTHFFCELQAISPNIREKASMHRLAFGLDRLKDFKKSSERFVVDAIESGDLEERSKTEVRRIANCSWSAEFGVTSYFLATQENQRYISPIVRKKLEEEIFWLVNTYMDGLGWKPLSTVSKPKEVWTKIKQDLFCEELEYMESRLKK